MNMYTIFHQISGNALLLVLIPLLPLIGFFINGIFGKSLSKTLSGAIGTLTVAISFIIALTLFWGLDASFSPFVVNLFEWFSVGTFKVSMGFQYDQLSALMLLIITGVGTLIHLYSSGYMHNDDGFQRFFAYLNLFIFFMLVLVLGSNFLVSFIGWEGVGLCSYLLIGFWFKNPAYNDAAKKAFVMNRIGDLGFLIAVFMIFFQFNSINYIDVMESAKGMASNSPILIAITLLLFVGATGKSAQLPLYTWLPDAMAGPTPVSALIHAATMVTAGIFLVVRSNVLFSLAPYTSEIVAIVGLITALFAASIGLRQNDIKKVLAYSTVSQLGYMFVALGVGAYSTAMFHVTTHAFFKALLFLGSGSVIHAMSGEQDIRFMGGLKKKLPITHITFLIGTLAIAGLPPFAGFFSKDEILAKVFMHNPIMFWALAFTSALTAFYMFRLYFLTFHGNFRGTEKQAHHLHESPLSMTLPLMVLAVASTLGGFLGMPAIMSNYNGFESYLSPIVSPSHGEHPSHMFEYTMMGVSVILLFIIIGYTRNRFATKQVIPVDVSEESGFAKTLANKYWVDEIYDTIIVKPMLFISQKLHQFFELQVIDGAVNGIGRLTNYGSQALRLIQTGNTGMYLIFMVVSIVLILLFNIIS